MRGAVHELSMSSSSNWLEVVSNVLLFFLIFGMSATVDFKNVKSSFSNKYAIVIGISLQFIVLPFLGFCAVKLFSNEFKSTAISVTLLVVTSSPGGSFSNWWCSLFNADLGLSVTMTAISTLLSGVMLPANLVLYANLVSLDDDDDNSDETTSVVDNIDWTSLFTALLVVICAIMSGIYFSYQNFPPNYRIIVNRIGTLSGLVLICFGFIASTFSENDEDDYDDDESSTKLWDKDWGFYVGVAFPCVSSIVLSTILASLIKLEKSERVTVAVECSYQNPGIATSVALAMYSNDSHERALALGVPIYYGFVEAIVCSLYCLFFWKVGWTKAPANERIWTILFTSYEIEECCNDGNDDVNDLIECVELAGEKLSSGSPRKFTSDESLNTRHE